MPQSISGAIFPKSAQQKLGRALLIIAKHRRRESGNFPSIRAPVNLQHAFFDSETDLEFALFGSKEHGFVTLADANWGDANLALVKWSFWDMLGDVVVPIWTDQ